MSNKQLEVGKQLIRSLYKPLPNSHKGQNGKVLVIGGSHLFHAASLWSLKVASRIVDMVFYSSVAENNELVKKAKEEFRDGIVVPREEIEEYINEADAILIGPGMERTEIPNSKLQIPNKFKILNLQNLENIDDPGLQTYLLTEYLLRKYPRKKWVVDAGSLQMMQPEWVPESAILTPHLKEFEQLKFKIQNSKFKNKMQNLKLDEQLKLFSKEYNCVVLFKGQRDLIASKNKFTFIEGGNPGMTKGGTGDVLAGLVAGFYAKNEALLSACAASFLNKLAGDRLYERLGTMFNASDLTDEIPITYKWCLDN
jgi:NAD(P)H-hydrate epimerase